MKPSAKLLAIVFFFCSSSFMSWLNGQPAPTPSKKIAMPISRFDELSTIAGKINHQCSQNIKCPNLNVENAKKLAEAIEQVIITLEKYKAWIEEGRRTTRWDDPQWNDANELVNKAYDTIIKTQKEFYSAVDKYILPQSYKGDPGLKWSDPYIAVQYLNARFAPQVQLLKQLQPGFALKPAISPSLLVPGKTFEPGQNITIEFTSQPCYDRDAWIGIVPSEIQHKNEKQSDQHKIACKHLDRKNSGTLTFTAPQKTGSYDFRMFDSEDNGNEVVSVSFRVIAKEEQPTKHPVTRNTNNAAADLVGIWEATGYSCTGQTIGTETIRITLQNDQLTAIKVTGDKCVPAGQITWQGKLSGNTISGKGHVSNGPNTAMYWIETTLKIVDKNTLQGSLGGTYRRQENYQAKWLVAFEYTAGSSQKGNFYALLKKNGKWDFAWNPGNKIDYSEYGNWTLTNNSITLTWKESSCNGTYQGTLTNPTTVNGTMTSSQGYKGTWTAKEIK